MTAQDFSMRRTALLIGMLTLLSRLLGLARDAATAWLLGTSAAGEALVIAMRVPHFVRRLFGEGSLSMHLTAGLMRAGDTGAGRAPDEGIMFSVAGDAHRIVCIVLFALMATAWISAAPIASITAPGACDAVLKEAADLLRICMPYTAFAVAASVCMGLMHACGRFFLPALSLPLFNICVLAFAALAFAGFGNAAYMLACGMLCGGAAQWCILRTSVYLSRRGLPHTPAPHGEAMKILKAAPSGTVGAAAPQMLMLCLSAAVSSLPTGAVAALYYAERLFEVPLGVLTAGLGIAGTPLLTSLTVQGKHAEFAEQTNTALRLSLALTLPAAAGLAAVADPLVRLLLQHGAFDAQAAALTVTALTGYLPALPACGCIRPLLAAAQARGLTHAPLRTALYAAAMCAGMLVLLLGTVPNGDAHALLLLTVSGSTALWVQPLMLMHAINRNLRPCRQRIGFSAAATVQAACGAAAAWGAATAACGMLHSPAAAVCLAVPSGIAAYAAVLLLCGNGDILDIYARLRIWWKKHHSKHDKHI